MTSSAFRLRRPCRTVPLSCPDFIIVEYNLSGMNGLEFLEKARQSERLGKIPILIAYNGREVGDHRTSRGGSGRESSFPLLPRHATSSGYRTAFLFLQRGEGSGLWWWMTVPIHPRVGFSSMFKELDYHVETAENGFEGYKAVERLKPDIITSDYDMPVLNGWEFCTEVRDHEEYKDIPIVMITTRATEMDMKKGELLGVSAYLAKPFQKDTLKSAVETAIAHARAKREQETIAKFVAADTLKSVNHMVDGRADAGKGESKFITVLFSDIWRFFREMRKVLGSQDHKLAEYLFRFDG